jgi:phenylpyruvate tautomerase
MSIGKLGVEENKRYSKEIATVLENRLNIPPTRFYINFTDAKPSEVGYNKSTFA